jgi:hypothetical protein
MNWGRARSRAAGAAGCAGKAANGPCAALRSTGRRQGALRARAGASAQGEEGGQ